MWVTIDRELAEQLAFNHHASFGVSVRLPRKTYYVGTFDELRSAGVMFAVTPIYNISSPPEEKTATMPPLRGG
jgi:hypothetical protein